MTRAEAEALIQRAIEALDALDGDPDMEPDPDEVSRDDDLEDDNCDVEPDGWPAVVGPQDGCEIRLGRRP